MTRSEGRRSKVFCLSLLNCSQHQNVERVGKGTTYYDHRGNIGTGGANDSVIRGATLSSEEETGDHTCASASVEKALRLWLVTHASSFLAPSARKKRSSKQRDAVIHLPSPYSSMTSTSSTPGRGAEDSEPEPSTSSNRDHQSGPDVFCKLCLCQHPPALARTLHSCACIFCKSCLQQYVQLSIKEGGGAPITCPDMACTNTGVLLDSEIAELASADQTKLYERLKFERGVKLDPSKTWCPVLDCQAVCDVPLSSEGQPSAVPCPTCHTIFCSGCKGPWQGSHTCPEQQPMKSQFGESSSDSESPIKQCPMCGIYIERNQGCAQMLCKSCKHTFCWYCLQNLDSDIFLRHYDKGPCRNKLGHSRASVMWNRTQVAGILVGVSIVMLITSPLLLLASPCILCCLCKPCRLKKKKRKKELSPADSSA